MQQQQQQQQQHMAVRGVISKTSRFSWNCTFRKPRPKFSGPSAACPTRFEQKRPPRKPGGLLILEIIPTKKPPNVSGGVSGNLCRVYGYTTSPRHPTGLGQEHRQQHLLSIMTASFYNTSAFLRILLRNNANRRKSPVKG